MAAIEQRALAAEREVKAVYLLYKLVQLAFSLYELPILLYVLLSWLRPAANRWTEMLRSVVEPLLTLRGLACYASQAPSGQKK